jgi:drug/metabolite transporter (DMT)-like permease
LLLVALSFTVAFAVSLVIWAVRRQNPLARLIQPPAAWALGVAGLFGYHFLYFLGLSQAPAVEANLINYLWPLLIVVFSGLLPGERIRWFHAAGVLMGLGGCWLLISGGGGTAFNPAHLTGYLAALGAALVWSGYSVLNRRFARVPSDAVGGFCGMTALLAFGAHLLFEPTVLPSGWEWLAIVGLGLGPVGLAFFVWDHGMKHGDIRALGALAYLAPVLSTLLLVVAGRTEANETLLIACLLVAAGAALAGGELWIGRRQPEG